MSRYSDSIIYRKGLKRFFGTTRYPEIPLSPDDMFIITNDGDRLDLLAQQLYSDKSLWWIISIANVDLSQNSLYIPSGTQLRVPIDIQSILSNFSLLNSI